MTEKRKSNYCLWKELW